MKVPFRWLQQYVEIAVTPEELAQRLTMAGLEAEEISYIGDDWDKIYVAHVRSVTPHPDADRLVLADVDAGEHRLTVVTGAPNIAEGQKVALALAGARLIDAYADEVKYKTLKPGKIRGVTSEGMVCSEKELGLSDEHEGILVLDPDAPAGVPLADFLGDAVIEFEITPNLVHAFSIIGIAREASALLNTPLKTPAESDLSQFKRSDELVTIDDPELNARYIGVVIEGVTVAPSPDWMARRLTAAGVRPVNNLVDITNYVMLEMGQPLHAFDLKTITSGTIVTRRGRDGEILETLDHRRRKLDDSMLLITDGGRPVAIAGVMGGVNSEIEDNTTAILLESANFDMVNIRHTSRELKLRTDASTRFERGIDPELARSAAQRAVHLILELCPTARVARYDDAYPSPTTPRQVSLPFGKIERVLGIAIDPGRVVEVLSGLELRPQLDESTDVLTVTVPTWRSDITIAEDVVEEVARMVGYTGLPATLPTGTTPPVERDSQFLLERSVRNTLAAAGLYEGRSYATLSHTDVERWSSKESVSLTDHVPHERLVSLKNPVHAERPVLRPSLVPSLAPAIAENLKHQTRVDLFEIAHVFSSGGPGQLPREAPHLAAAFSGRRDELGRFSPMSEMMDIWDAKGVLDALSDRLGVSFVYEKTEHPSLHPGRSAAISGNGRRLGVLGEVHPSVAAEYDIEHRIAVFELDLELLHSLIPSSKATQIRADQYLPVQQDFSAVVRKQTPANSIRAALMQGAGALATNIVLFDVYEGEPLDDDLKSLTFRVTFTSPERALTDKELGKVRKRIEKTLKRDVDAMLRS